MAKVSASCRAVGAVGAVGAVRAVRAVGAVGAVQKVDLEVRKLLGSQTRLLSGVMYCVAGVITQV